MMTIVIACIDDDQYDRSWPQLCYDRVMTQQYNDKVMMMITVNIMTINRIMSMMTLAYFMILVTLMLVGDPYTVVATGVHQEFGECNVTETDLSGYPRFAYLCGESYDEDFRIARRPNPHQAEIVASTTDCTSNRCAGISRTLARLFDSLFRRRR